MNPSFHASSTTILDAVETELSSSERSSSLAKQSGELETLQRFLNESFASELPEDPPKGYDITTDPDALVKDMSDLRGKALVRSSQHLINSAGRLRIDKRRVELHHQADVYKNGPRGEKRSAVLVERVEWIPLRLIIDDPKFVNLRLPAEEDRLQALSESMRHEGLKVPITLIAAPNDNGFYVRAGFRRTAVARQLGWERIPAVILPANTPTIEEYWTNVIENSNRSQLHSYEIAVAAKTMRDKFHVSPLDFALRAGYTEGYIHNLLRCLDRLPNEVLTAWRERAHIPVDLYIKWAIMEPDEAVKMMLLYAGRNPHLVKDWQPPINRPRPLAIKMASTRGLQRMQKVRFAIGMTKMLDEKTRNLCLKVVDFCTGAREDVPGIYNPQIRQNHYTIARDEDLKMPELGDNAPLPVALNNDDKKENN